MSCIHPSFKDPSKAYEGISELLDYRFDSILVGDGRMPIGNLTSQFFANVYLNGLDHFIKRRGGGFLHKIR